MAIDDGGQVFPTMNKVGEYAKTEGGLTVRQFYAGMALPSLAKMWEDNEVVAAHALGIADAVIKAEKADA